jgi:hypothetical protein
MTRLYRLQTAIAYANYKQNRCPIKDINHASKDELMDYIEKFDTHIDRSNRHFAISIKMWDIVAPRSVKDSLWSFLELPELPFELQFVFEDNLANFENEKIIDGAYTIYQEGRSGGWLVLYNKNGGGGSKNDFLEYINEDIGDDTCNVERLREICKVLATFGRYADYIIGEFIYYAMTHDVVEKEITIKQKVKVSKHIYEEVEYA